MTEFIVNNMFKIEWKTIPALLYCIWVRLVEGDSTQLQGDCLALQDQVRLTKALI